MCRCGCGKRATHAGLGDGIVLMVGCLLSVRRWVRDGYPDGQESVDRNLNDPCTNVQA